MLEQHILIHFDINKSIWNDSKDSYDDLQHNFIHNSIYQYDFEELFTCSECGYQTLDKENLKYHINTHFIENPLFSMSDDVKKTGNDGLGSKLYMIKETIPENHGEFDNEYFCKSENFLEFSNGSYETPTKENCIHGACSHINSNDSYTPNDVNLSDDVTKLPTLTQRKTFMQEKGVHLSNDKFSMGNSNPHLILDDQSRIPDPIHIQETEYVCGICRLEVTSECKSISCDDCKGWVHIECSAIDEDDYDRLVENGDKLEFVCEKCLQNLKQHSMTNVGDRYKKYKCKYCGEYFSREDAFMKHLKYHSEDKCNNDSQNREEEHFKCSYCGNKYKSKEKLNRHITNHLGDEGKKYKCKYCKKGFARKDVLTKHMDNHTQNPEEERFECSYCDKDYKNKDKLKEHFQIHLREKLHSCSECEYECVQKVDLKKHIMTHMGDQAKKYECTYCEKRFARKDVFMKHQNRHTQEKQFKCTECDYICYRKDLLNVHRLNHTGEKPYECSSCDFKSYIKCNLNAHEKCVHIKEKPYVCNMCDYSASIKNSLQNHILKYHM